VTEISAAKETKAVRAPKAEKAAPAAKLLPTTIAAPLVWTDADEVHTAQDGKYTYRVREGTEGGWYASLKTAGG
jgi:hypothetical protein